MSHTTVTHGDAYMPRVDDDDPDDDDDTIPPPVGYSIRHIITRIWSLLFRPFSELFFLFTWIIWLFSSITLSTGQLSIVIYSAIRITISIILYIGIIIGFQIHNILEKLYTICICFNSRHLPRIEKIRLGKRSLATASSLDEYQLYALELDTLCQHNKWKQQDISTEYDYKTLRHISHELILCRHACNWKGLVFHLSNILNRQFCNLQSEKLYSHCYHGTKYAIEEFYCRVVEQLSFVAKTDFGTEFNTRHKLRFFQRARRTLGKTVLCLSGGGAHAMYHCGVARAMVKGNCLPSVINGTSGGSIIAALIGTRTDSELKDPSFFAPSLCNKYGVQYRWLPTLQSQVDQFISHRVLMDSADFNSAAKIFFGAECTFIDAYKLTQRVLCITVTYSARVSGSRSHPLVLNHISSPHVYVWSAVSCSCSLPGLMKPQNLFAKGPDGTPVEYYPAGCEIIDGSLQADIPVQRLTELFNAQTFVISQTNPHVNFLVRDGREGLGSESQHWFGRMSQSHQVLSGCEKFLQADLAHRLTRLAKMKIIPKIYNQDFGQVISGKQQYTGDITIVPRIPFIMRFKVLTHPSEDDMQEYFRGGETATYPKIARIQNCLLLERTLEECVRSLISKIKHDEEQKTRRKGKQTTKTNTTHTEHTSNTRNDMRPKDEENTVNQKTTTHSSTPVTDVVLPLPPLPSDSSSTPITFSSAVRSSLPPPPASPPQSLRASNKSSPVTPRRTVIGTSVGSSSSSLHTPPRPHVHGVVLPSSLLSASSAAFYRRRSFSHPDRCTDTPTAKILVDLPLHGGDTNQITEMEYEQDNDIHTEEQDEHEEHGGGESNWDNPTVTHTAAHVTDRPSDAVRRSSSSSPHDVDVTSSLLSIGYDSDRSTTTTTSYLDFDAEELANQDIDLPEEDEQQTPTPNPSTPASTSRSGSFMIKRPHNMVPRTLQAPT